MANIKILDKDFELFIPHEEIISRIEHMALKMNQSLDRQNTVFLCILSGAFLFASEIFKRITIPNAEISFVKLSSYAGDHSTGEVKELIGIHQNLEGRTVVILEDIIDSGLTIEKITEQLKIMNPAAIKTATLLLKPEALTRNINIDYVGLKIPNVFIVGYGLDYKEKGRNLRDIYKVVTRE